LSVSNKMVDRKTELIQIKKEEEQLKTTFWKYESQLNNIFNESENIQQKLSEIENECQEKKNQTCLNFYDSYLIALNSINRKIHKSNNDANKKCFETIPYSLRPQQEGKWDVKSQEGLTELRKYVICSEPFYKEVIGFHYDDLSLKKEVDKKIRELVNNS